MPRPSLRVRRIRAAEDADVAAELSAALEARWSESGLESLDVDAHALTVAGMYAAMATEEEVAAYLRGVEGRAGAPDADDVALAAALLRIVLRLDAPDP